jgi:AraC-like DNA-binding protein
MASSLKTRRRVDWEILLGSKPLPPTPVEQPIPDALSALRSAMDELAGLSEPDDIIRRAVELGRDRIGLVRTAIFVLDRRRGLMLGTWGSDLNGGLVDERDIMYAVSATDREAFQRAEQGQAHFTVFDRCPIVEHRGGKTVVRGRGWVAHTPIRSGQTTIGMLFNDAGISAEPVNATKQAHAAILCALVGAVLNRVRGAYTLGATRMKDVSSRRLADAATEMIAAEPATSCKEIADRLGLSHNHFTRVFRAEVGMSVVEYRNRLRLDRFSWLVQKDRPNLGEAALASGFGSYAQFHRVFRAFRRTTPREYLRKLA